MGSDLIFHPIFCNIPEPGEAFLVTCDFVIIRASCAWAIQVMPDAKPNSNTYNQIFIIKSLQTSCRKSEEGNLCYLSRSAKMFFS